MNMAITHQGKTDVGRMRQNNEDAFYPDPRDGTVDPSGVARGGHLFIVADGVGGNRGGARASQMAVTRLPAVYYSATNGDPAHGLRVAFNGVAHEVVAEAATNPERANMSCTVVAAVVKDGAATIAHLGDARAYLLRGGALQPLTTDHTWVQMQVEKGTLSAAEAENHPDRNVITKSMGNPAFPEPTVRQIALQEGDRLLLCSDGLCGLVSDAEMAAVLNRAPDPAAAVGPLIDLANRKGGTDNITALVIQAGRPATVAAPRRSNAGLWVGLFALVVMLGAALFLWRPGGGAAGGTPVAEAAATSEPGAPVAALAGGDETAAPGEATSTLAAGVVPTATATPTLAATSSVTTAASAVVGSGAPTAVATFRTAVPPLDLQPIAVDPRPAACPPPADASHYSGSRPIVFRWRLNSAPGSDGYFLVAAGPLDSMSEQARVSVNSPSGDNEWSASIPIGNIHVDDVTVYQWQVTLVLPGGINTPGEAFCFIISDSGGSAGGATEASPTPGPPTPTTDPDSDGDGIPDSLDKCPNEPAGDDPDPDRPGCPVPEPTQAATTTPP